MNVPSSLAAVLVVDDQLVQREGIARVVEATGAMRVVGTAGTAEEALALLAGQHVDLALVDLVLREQRGIAIGRSLRQLQPDLKVIIYTREKSLVLAAEIFRRQPEEQPGLQGYLLTRNISSSHYLRVVYDQILEQGYYIDPDVLRWHYQLAELEPLTPREEECALLVARGLGNNEIAGQMLVSRRRVENLINNLYLKFRIFGDPGDPARRVLLAESVRLHLRQAHPAPLIKVLMVDDQEEQRRRLRGLLSAEPRLQVVAEAATGEQGVEQALAKRPDLALVDVLLPDLNGFQVARQILQACPQVKVILHSAEASPTFESEAYRAGAMAFLPKSRLNAAAILALWSPETD